ncbi:MAG: LacI family transcriptional regulator [Microbacteriaceae bacterium]|nr:LacI family transcriptional regulator [Microbacteriaceae bacterium]
MIGRPTMNDVASDAGVSLKTVSRVVNNVATVDPELVAKVFASIKSLGYRRNGIAASLRAGGETRMIGLITEDLSNTFYITLASAVAKVARARGFQVIMASSEEDPEIERELALDLCQRRVSGLLVVPTSADHHYLQAEMDLGVAVVFIDRPGSGLDADAILVDNQGGARSAVERLISNGHRRIGLLMDSLSIYTMRERLAGARDALAAAGADDDPALLVENVHAPDDAASAVRAMLDLAEPPTAILCGNNRSTIGAVEEVWRSRASIEIVGFDDFEMSRLLPQPVTIVDYDTSALGTRAAERLFDRIDGIASEPFEQLLPTHLVDRGVSWALAPS